VVSGANSSEIRKRAIADGMATLMMDGMQKVQSGLTTPAEVIRSAYAPE
jgi:type II secretory ATPase GspE/PulE/Tfp pilus assembly ATPase PilB-like protein